MNLEQRARLHAALSEPARLRIVDDLALGDASPSELGGRYGLASNLLAFHLGVLVDAGVVRRVRSEGDRRRQYVQLRLDDPVVAALTRPVDTSLLTAREVVFVCTANSARSQLAAAVWRRASDVPVRSVGTHPAPQVHPGAVAAGRRHGLDLTGAATTALHQAAPGSDAVVVAVCDSAHEELTRSQSRGSGATGPWSWLHWHVPDPVPAGTHDAFEAAYADLAERVRRLVPAVTRTAA